MCLSLNVSFHSDGLFWIVGGVGDDVEGGILAVAAALSLESPSQVNGLAGLNGHRSDFIGEGGHTAFNFSDDECGFAGICDFNHIACRGVLSDGVEIEVHFIVSGDGGFGKVLGG